MSDPISLASILNEQLEWVPDTDDPSGDEKPEEPSELPEGPPISSLLAEPEWAIILRANAKQTVDLIRGYLDYRGNSARVSRMRLGDIQAKLAFLYDLLLMVGRRRDRPKPRPDSPLDGSCIVGTYVLLRNGWICRHVHLSYIELHDMFRTLTCPRPEEAHITREKYFATVLGSLEVIVKLLEPMHEPDSSEAGAPRLQRESTELPTRNDAVMTPAESETREAMAADSGGACGRGNEVPPERVDERDNPWLMTVPPDPEKHVLELDGRLFDLDDEDVLLHMSDHINTSRSKNTVPAASGRRSEPPVSPASRALGAAYDLRKQGKRVSIRAACLAARVDRKNLTANHPEVIEVIKRLAQPDGMPPSGKWDRRTGKFEAVDDSQED
jgi:hypothetical protein